MFYALTHESVTVAEGHDSSGLFACYYWYGNHWQGNDPIPNVYLFLNNTRLSTEETHALLTDMDGVVWKRSGNPPGREWSNKTEEEMWAECPDPAGERFRSIREQQLGDLINEDHDLYTARKGK